MKYIIILFLIVFILRAVFKFLFPVINMSRHATDHMKRMQDQINEMNRRQQEPEVRKKPFGKKGDYIDYEEVR